MAQETKTWTVVEACERQATLCRESALPHFAPHNGVCWACFRQIYAPNGVDGSAFVTGCPFCARSYVD